MAKTVKTLASKGFADKKPIWVDVARRLNRPTRRRAEVNVSKLERFCKEGETILVPGKVLSSGSLSKKLTVAAWAFSKAAREKIEKSGGRCMGLEELLESQKVSGFRIFE